MQLVQPAVRLVIVLAVSALSACGGSDTSPQSQQQGQKNDEQRLAEVTIIASDGSIEMPPSIGSEPTLFVFENEGSRPYEAKFARLNEGVTPKDLQASLRKGPDAVFSLITLAGELLRTAPGESETLTIKLATGNYVVVDPKYAARGMVQPFEVVTGTDATAEPPSDVEVALNDFVIDMPTTLSSGAATFKIANEGGQAHEIVLLKEGEKPGRHSPGMTPFNPGSTVWEEFDLEPGKYTAVCYFPDAETGKSHAALGMRTDLVVE